MDITYSPKFISQFKKLPKNIKLLVVKKEKLFLRDPFDPRLKTHKLIGYFKDYWSFSVDYKNRIVFKLTSKRSAWFLSVGSHDIYKN